MTSNEFTKYPFDKEKEGATEIRSLSDIEGDGRISGKFYVFLDDIIIHLKNGVPHNENGPAEIWRVGSVWYKNDDKLHRLDGPACVAKDYYDGPCSGVGYAWYVNGHNIEKEEVNHWLTENGIPLDWNTWTDSEKDRFANYWLGYFN